MKSQTPEFTTARQLIEQHTAKPAPVLSTAKPAPRLPVAPTQKPKVAPPQITSFSRLSIQPTHSTPQTPRKRKRPDFTESEGSRLPTPPPTRDARAKQPIDFFNLAEDGNDSEDEFKAQQHQWLAEYALSSDSETETEDEKAPDLERYNKDLLAKITSNPRFRVRNPPIQWPTRTLEEVPFESGILEPGNYVFLKNNTIFGIKDIITRSGRTLLRGWVYKSTIDMPMLEYHAHEYYLEMHIDQDDPRPYLEQSVKEIEVKEVKRIVNAVITNESYDKYSNIENLRKIRREEGLPVSWVRDREIYVICWKYITFYPNAEVRRALSTCVDKLGSQKVSGRSFERFAEEECTPGRYLPVDELRYNFRGVTTNLGGSFAVRSTGNKKTDRQFDVNSLPGPLPAGIETTEDVEDEYTAYQRQKKARTESQQPLTPLQKLVLKSKVSRLSNSGRKALLRFYTMGDNFSGAGGMTSGAWLARLKIVFGFEKNPNAALNWNKNFPQAHMFNMTAEEFLRLSDPDQKLIVDILHLSPPCQIVAKCKTTTGKNDKENEAALYVISECLEKSRPRVVTLEESDGIIQKKKNIVFFHTVIKQFTSVGYSCRWQVLGMEKVGVPQKRLRVIIIASWYVYSLFSSSWFYNGSTKLLSCHSPGEALPPFIKPTHASPEDIASNPSTTQYLKPFVLPIDVLSIPRPSPIDHDLKPAKPRTSYKTWDPRKLVNTITCKKPIPHWLERRAITTYERKKLMGFCDGHVFEGREVNTQIGNAVPPVAGKVIMEQVTRGGTGTSLGTGAQSIPAPEPRRGRAQPHACVRVRGCCGGAFDRDQSHLEDHLRRGDSLMGETGVHDGGRRRLGADRSRRCPWAKLRGRAALRARFAAAGHAEGEGHARR